MSKFLRTLSRPAMLNKASTTSDDYLFQPGECPNCQQGTMVDTLTTVEILAGILFFPIRRMKYKKIRCTSCDFITQKNNAT